MVEVSNTYHLNFTGPCVRTMPLPKYNEFFLISTLHIAIDFPVKNEHRSAIRSGTSVYYCIDDPESKFDNSKNLSFIKILFNKILM